MNLQENKPEKPPEATFTSDQQLLAQKKVLELKLENLKERYFAHRLTNREYYRQFEEINFQIIEIQRCFRDLHFKSN